jgi:hypothetical protein
VDPSWERTHPGVPELWSFDFFTSDGSLGGFCSMVFHPEPGRAWYWATLAGTGRPYLLVRELDVALPRLAGSRQVRAEGLWADINCEVPFDHWSLGLEAFGVAMDDPSEALRTERGDRIGLGLDLEWEAAGDIIGGDGAYYQPCSVHGEVLVGVGSDVEKLDFEGNGWRRHAWGRLDCLQPGWQWLGGLLDEGTYEMTHQVGRRASQTIQRAPLLLEFRQRRAILERRLCRFISEDGKTGVGWSESVT